MSGKKKLDVLCSPRTYRMIEVDKNYRQQVTQHVTRGEVFDEEIFSQNNDPQQPNNNCDQQVPPQSDIISAKDGPAAVSPHSDIADSIDVPAAMSPQSDIAGSMDGQTTANSETNEFSYADVLEDQKTVWLDANIRFLISRVKDLRPKVDKSINLKNKKQMWSKIAEEMCAKGEIFNAQQVEAKYFSLERQYKTGRNRQSCPYQKELDDLFLERKCINPDYTLDNEQEITPEDVCSSKTRDDLETSLSECLDVPTSTSRKRKTSMELYMEKAEQHALKREKQDLMLQKMLEESIKKKEDRAQRKELLELRKLELLEKLINSLSK